MSRVVGRRVNLHHALNAKMLKQEVKKAAFRNIIVALNSKVVDTETDVNFKLVLARVNKNKKILEFCRGDIPNPNYICSFGFDILYTEKTGFVNSEQKPIKVPSLALMTEHTDHETMDRAIVGFIMR